MAQAVKSEWLCQQRNIFFHRILFKEIERELSIRRRSDPEPGFFPTVDHEGIPAT
jgi:hypothetical protein